MSADLLSAPMGQAEFAAIVRTRLTDLGRGQLWLGSEVARLVDRPQPYAQTAVSGWIVGANGVEPDVAFAMERALGLRPGDLSRHLGYLPVAARPEPVGVEAAIAADPRLSATLKRALLAAYRELVADS